MKIIETLSTAAANWINGGAFVNREKIRATDISVESNVIFTKSATKKVVRIPGIKPVNTDLAFVDYIRDKMFSLHPNVDVIINIENNPIPLSATDPKFQRALARASESYQSYKDAFDSQKGLSKMIGKTYNLGNGVKLRLSKEKLDDLYQAFISYYELFNYLSGGGTLVECNIFIELVGDNIPEINRAENDLYGILAPYNIGCAEQSNVLKSYLIEFGPMNFIRPQHHKKFRSQMLFTENNQGAFASYKSRGLVGEKGILLGMDFRSRFPFMVDIFSSSAAQVYVLGGRTGSGKTYAANQIAISAMAMGQYVSAIDIKGREWSKLSVVMTPTILTFDDRHPSFVNTMRLDDLKVNSKEDAYEFFATAMKGTSNMLSLAVNLQPGEGNPNDLEMILHESVSKLFSLHRVTPDNPNSFQNTKHIRYSDILPILEDLSHTGSYTADQLAMINLTRTRCHAFFGDSGIFSQAFKNEVSLSDVLDSQFVIYEFNKNQNAMTDTLDAVRIFMVQFLDSKKKAVLRSEGKYLFCFYEELQRCDQFGDLLEYICADVTGSRSNNAVIFLLLNSLRVLQSKRAQDIRSNITSFIMGRLNPDDIRSLEEEFGQPWLASQLRIFEEQQTIFANCFAANIDTGSDVVQSVYKVYFPEELSEALRTRTVLKEE